MPRTKLAKIIVQFVVLVSITMATVIPTLAGGNDPTLDQPTEDPWREFRQCKVSFVVINRDGPNNYDMIVAVLDRTSTQAFKYLAPRKGPGVRGEIKVNSLDQIILSPTQLVSVYNDQGLLGWGIPFSKDNPLRLRAPLFCSGEPPEPIRWTPAEERKQLSDAINLWDSEDEIHQFVFHSPENEVTRELASIVQACLKHYLLDSSFHSSLEE